MRNQMTLDVARILALLKVAALPAFFFLLNIIFIVLGWYQQFAHLDSIMHIASGFVVALAARDFFRLDGDFFSFKHAFFDYVALVAMTSLVAVFWEFGEFMVDYYFKIGLQNGQADTMLDLFLGVLGGAVFALFSVFSARE